MSECAIALPSEVNLPVRYKSQRDNENNPSGSCNVTSCAMVLDFFGKRGNGDGQFEDQLYIECQERGLSRHDPYDLQTLMRSHGINDEFREDAKWSDAKAHLAAGSPLICHGYFTKFGHIIVIRGYVPNGWIVNDPWGEIMF
ncbi:MAG TPA: C39 family peptidase, partial [Allocoleopsis sp.]